MNTDLIKLKEDLKNFGLNPSDWKLRQLKKSQYKIANIQDRQFYFVGKATQEGPFPKWSQIHLMSF